jgi:nucleotide-binding universal stress UspA family protein
LGARNRLGRRVQLSPAVRLSVSNGATAIINAARTHGADVIVVGSHHRNWFSKLFHGSTSDDVIDEANIPVLVVPGDQSDD